MSRALVGFNEGLLFSRYLLCQFPPIFSWNWKRGFKEPCRNEIGEQAGTRPDTGFGGHAASLDYISGTMEDRWGSSSRQLSCRLGAARSLDDSLVGACSPQVLSPCVKQRCFLLESACDVLQILHLQQGMGMWDAMYGSQA